MGSGNDWQLNRNVSRIKTTDFDAARKNISNYETTGNLLKPLVSLHNTGDPLSLYWHETLYRYKLLKSHAASMQTNISVAKYGRNDFTSSEVMASLALLVYKVTLSNLNIPEKAFTSSQMENELLQKSKELSIDPKIIKYNIPVVGD